MNTIYSASWIGTATDKKPVSPTFSKKIDVSKEISSAQLNITAYGVYEATLNGSRISDFILAPAWTVYRSRVQYQTYDITSEFKYGENEIDVTLGNGWALGNLMGNIKRERFNDTPIFIASIDIIYKDGTTKTIITDDSWTAKTSHILMSEIYDGETQDFTADIEDLGQAKIFDNSKDIIIQQQGEKVVEVDRLPAVEFIITPKGEKVIDFGQNMTGYVEVNVKGKAGDEISFCHAEVLDSDGNFYNENYRAAKATANYILDGQKTSYKPRFTFYGFRYIRIEEFPTDIELKTDNFTAITVHSDLKRTGYFECSNEKVNRLFENIIWGQKSNFLDVPTDCPQRDERLGWTGDAQVFTKAASYNFDVEKFFTKWLTDLHIDQKYWGAVPHVVPNVLNEEPRKEDISGSAAWGDAATVCPWQIYLTYGDKEILERQFESMTLWIDYITKVTTKENLWVGGHHYGDWLALEIEDDYYGATDKYFIASAFYAYSTSLVIKAGAVLGKDVTKYEELYDRIIEAFNAEYVKGDTLAFDTQTAYVLVLHFDLVENRAAMLKRLTELINARGNALSTGFVGTPYLLHVLSDNGESELAYKLLLREEYPGWLYPVTKGATTMWEHWDGIKPDGSMWSKEMNSFNHYAYGAVGDWLYGNVIGINLDEKIPGFEHVILKPEFTELMDYAKGSVISKKYGEISAGWEKKSNGKFCYTFTIPNDTSATLKIAGKNDTDYTSGTYTLEL